MNIDEKLKEYRQKVNQIQATQTESKEQVLSHLRSLYDPNT
jgi:hypothetical protein